MYGILLSFIRHIRQRYLVRNSFIFNVLTLMSGATLSQALSVLVSPIITRLYSPRDFGIYALYFAIVSLFGIIITGRYEMAIMLPKSDEDAVNIAALCLIITFLIGSLSLLIVFIFNTNISSLLGEPNISKWLYLLPITLLFSGTYQTINYWLNRNKLYSWMSYSRITQSVTTAMTNIGLGYAGYGAGGLIFGSVACQGFIISLMGYLVWKRDKEKFKWTSKRSILDNARRYKDFPKINSLHAFVDNLQNSLTLYFISAFAGVSALGFYSLGIRVLKMPLSLIGGAVAQIFFQKGAEYYNEGRNLKKLVISIMVTLGIFALPFFIILIFYAPSLFSIIFGKEWEEAGIYVQILSPWLFLNFLVSPISQVTVIVNKLKAALAISFVGNLSITLSVFYGGYIAKDILKGFYLLSILLTIYYILLIIWIINISARRKENV
jgi:O-antigen/teichoic acid export membrane protein